MFKEWICIERLDGKSEYMFVSDDNECVFVACPEANYCKWYVNAMYDLQYEIFEWITSAKSIEWIDDDNIEDFFESMMECAENDEQRNDLEKLFAPFLEEGE